MNTNQEKEQKSDKYNPWYMFLIGLGLFGFSFYVYHECNALEMAGKQFMRTSRTASPIAFLYFLGGKWLPTIAFALIGLRTMALCIRDFLRNKS